MSNLFCHPERGRMPEAKDPENASVTMPPQSIFTWILSSGSTSWRAIAELCTSESQTILLCVSANKAAEIEGFAKKYRCTRLVYFESFDNVLKAICREKQLKCWRRSEKITLIQI